MPSSTAVAVDLTSSMCRGGSDDEGGVGVALRAAEARVLRIAAGREEVPHLHNNIANLQSWVVQHEQDDLGCALASTFALRQNCTA